VLLVEVQALTASSVIGAAKRKVSGVSSDRVAMIIAVLEKRADLRLAADDVFVNVAGGVKVTEPATTSPSRWRSPRPQNRPLPAGTFAGGGTGLAARWRTVPNSSTASARHPPRPRARHRAARRRQVPRLGGMALHEVRRLSQAMSDL
jgi:DNA repair protein RadA/Sms